MDSVIKSLSFGGMPVIAATRAATSASSGAAEGFTDWSDRAGCHRGDGSGVRCSESSRGIRAGRRSGRSGTHKPLLSDDFPRASVDESVQLLDRWCVQEGWDVEQ
jgi:hypothetical protein